MSMMQAACSKLQDLIAATPELAVILHCWSDKPLKRPVRALGDAKQMPSS